MLGTEPNIKDEFIRGGKVKMVFNHILDFGNSARLSQAAECAGDQGRFWAMHDLLFEQQGRLFSGNPDPTLLGLARDLQLDEAAFGQCLSSSKYADFVRQVDAEAKAAGIRVRPTFILGQRRIQGALPWPQFQASLAEATK